MKNFTLLLSLLVGIGSFAQNSINLEFNHKVGSEDLEYNTEFDIPNGHVAMLDRCEYYISQISLVHDGGMTTSIDDMWLLVDAFDQMTFDLGVYDIEVVESINFSVGVETPTNNNDPSAWPNSHPLSPQNPSMHWGWSAGYRFLAMEGKSGTNSANYVLEVHALGNSNYHDQSLDLSATAAGGQLNIAITADYLEAFDGVSTAAGGITHGESGDAVDMLNNFRDEVFSAGEFVSVNEIEAEAISFQIAPNPTMNGEHSRIILDLNNSRNFNLEITDLSGKLIHSEPVTGSTTVLDLPSVQSGVYLVNMKSENSVVITQKWIVK